MGEVISVSAKTFNKLTAAGNIKWEKIILVY